MDDSERSSCWTQNTTKERAGLRCLRPSFPSGFATLTQMHEGKQRNRKPELFPQNTVLVASHLHEKSWGHLGPFQFYAPHWGGGGEAGAAWFRAGSETTQPGLNLDSARLTM